MMRRGCVLVVMLLCAVAAAIASEAQKRCVMYAGQNPELAINCNYDNYFSLSPRNIFLSLLYSSSKSKPNLGYSPASKPLVTPAKRYDSYGCVVASASSCPDSIYRSYDGYCNNLYYPSWGMANTKYARILPANYADGIYKPTVSKSRRPLPPAREISLTLHPDYYVPDPKWTLIAMQWGQLISHDMSLFAEPDDSDTYGTKCCSKRGKILREARSNPLCYPIIISKYDPDYSYEDRECRNYIRTVTDYYRGCSSKQQPAEQLSVVTSFLDLSVTYGSDSKVAASLRTGYGGLLLTEKRNYREWLPSAYNKSAACDVDSEYEICYRAGDVRVNQNPQLTILQVIIHREHNRIAKVLAYLNPHWNDETIFQQARKITIAIYQHITYYEWLTIFIGKQNAYARKILYNTKGYVNDYDSYVDPSVINEHATAAFRYFHSLIVGRLLLVDEPRRAYSYDSLRLSNHFNRPCIIEQGDVFDQLTRGLSFQAQQSQDQFFSMEITKYLFKKRKMLGGDLRAIDIHRARDHGLASYNDYRALFGLPRAVEWKDFEDLISPENIEKLSSLYESPDDVDLTVGGSLERHVAGTLVGPTFLYILSEQFYRTRVGDRYWYETPNRKIGFTVEQLAEIRKASVARLLCDHGDYIESMQLRAFEKISEYNPVVRCEDIPAIDLNLWRSAPSVSSYY